MFLVVLVAAASAPGTALRPAAARAAACCRCCPSGYVDRLSTITNIEADATGSAQGRWTRHPRSPSDVVAQNPVIGVGIGQDILAMNDERGADSGRAVHNAYLQYARRPRHPGPAALRLAAPDAASGRARAVERRAAARSGAPRSRACWRRACRSSLVAFAVAAMFHPIAYQFYFFCVGGLAVALRDTTCRAGRCACLERGVTRRVTRRADPLKVVPTLMCGGTENQFMTLGRPLDPRALRSRVRLPAALGPFVKEIADRRIPLSEYQVSTFRSVQALAQQARLARHIARRGIQIVHAYNFYGNVFADPAGPAGARRSSSPRSATARRI